MPRYQPKRNAATPIDWGNPINKGLGSLIRASAGGGAIARDIASQKQGVITAPAWEVGDRGNALKFNGSSTYISLGGTGDFNYGTVSLLARIRVGASGLGTYARIIEKVYSTSYCLCANASGGKLKGIFAHSSTPYGGLESTTILTAGQWYHVVVTHDGQVDKLFVNGKLEAQEANTAVLSASTIVNIGRYTGGGFFFSGLIDLAGIYSRAISEKEVRQLYNDPDCMLVRPARGVGLAAASGLTLTVSDGITLGDSVTKAVNHAGSDSLTVSDSLSKSCAKSASDGFSLSDIIANSTSKISSDSFNLVDALALMARKSVSDSITLSDSAQAMLVLIINVVDSFSLGDSISKSLHKQVADIITIADLVAKAVGKTLSEVLTLSDLAQLLGGNVSEVTDGPTAFRFLDGRNHLAFVDSRTFLS